MYAAIYRYWTHLLSSVSPFRGFLVPLFLPLEHLHVAPRARVREQRKGQCTKRWGFPACFPPATATSREQTTGRYVYNFRMNARCLWPCFFSVILYSGFKHIAYGRVLKVLTSALRLNYVQVRAMIKMAWKSRARSAGWYLRGCKKKTETHLFR